MVISIVYPTVDREIEKLNDPNVKFTDITISPDFSEKPDKLKELFEKLKQATNVGAVVLEFGENFELSKQFLKDTFEVLQANPRIISFTFQLEEISVLKVDLDFIQDMVKILALDSLKHINMYDANLDYACGDKKFEYEDNDEETKEQVKELLEPLIFSKVGQIASRFMNLLLLDSMCKHKLENIEKDYPYFDYVRLDLLNRNFRHLEYLKTQKYIEQYRNTLKFICGFYGLTPDNMYRDENKERFAELLKEESPVDESSVPASAAPKPRGPRS